MIENFIKFPVQLEIQADKINVCMRQKKEKQVVSIHKDWKGLTTSIPTDGHDHYGILTGKKNKITVVDLSEDIDFPVDISGIGMFNVSTPAFGTHYYFQYEEKLESIYNTLPGVSVINDRGCVFFGATYKLLNRYPIAKMPDALFNILYDQQINRPVEPINQELYELFSILPSKWFNEEDLTIQLIHVMRNENASRKVRNMETLRRLLDEQSEMYYEQAFVKRYNARMSYKQQRFGLPALKKIIKSDYPDQYDEWFNKWKISKSVELPQLIYTPGASIKLSDLKTACKAKLTVSTILQMDNRFTLSVHNICKFCLNKHKKDCCDNYERTVRKICQFIDNVVLG